MNKTNSPETGQEVLAQLIHFVQDPEEVAHMSTQDVEAALQAEGIDIKPGLRRLQQRLAAIRGEQRLQRAAREREAALARETRTSATTPPVDLRAEVIRRLSHLVQQPQAYFRNLDEMTDADLQALLADLEQLQSGKDDGPAEPRA